MRGLVKLFVKELLVLERMPPKRRNKRRRMESEVTTPGVDANQGSRTDDSPRQEAITGEVRQDATGDPPSGSGRSNGRPSDPLTREDIPGIIEEITRQLRPDSNGSHTSLTPGLC